jgi:hypothetical protein
MAEESATLLVKKRRLDKNYTIGKIENREMLAKLLKYLEAASGFEPENNGFADRRLTTWLCRHWTSTLRVESSVMMIASLIQNSTTKTHHRF